MYNQTQAKRLPYLYYYFPIALLSLTGICISIYLAISHYKNYTDLGYSSFCAISKAINCDTVSESPWSIIFGVPIAYWGVLGFSFLTALIVCAFHKDKTIAHKWLFITILCFIYCLFSVAFGALSALKIGAYCILCISIYAICFALFFFCLIIYRRFGSETIRVQDIRDGFSLLFLNSTGFTIGLTFLVCAFLMIIFVPPYWNLEIPETPVELPTGVTENGSHWIGAIEPEIIIEEYSDYQCFQCAKTHRALRQLVHLHSDKVRLVHRHYPLDHEFNDVILDEPFHVGSGKMSLLAIYAGTKGKFWEMNDALYQLARTKEPFNTNTLAKKLHLDPAEITASIDYDPFKKKLALDIWQGLKLRITATPSFVINGKVYNGELPKNFLANLE
ncbi:MAG: thioredoxin domain-containing protein [Desulfobulbaceae bacterium]|nr:thioredoxin domain-containing protein [Desulfobulbaceae bacterium]